MPNWVVSRMSNKALSNGPQSAKARVISVHEEGISVELIGTSPQEAFSVSFQDLFLAKGPVRPHPALVTCGQEVIRPDDVIQLDQQDDGVWSRAAFLLRSLEELKGKHVLSGYVTGFQSRWILLSVAGGVPAVCPRKEVEDYFMGKPGLLPKAEHLPLNGHLRIGDPVSGYVVQTEDPQQIVVDIATHLRDSQDGRIEDWRFENQESKARAIRRSPPKNSLELDAERVACPTGARGFLLIDDDPIWSPDYMMPWLSKSGADVKWLSEREGWTRAEDVAQRLKPDIIFVDLKLDDGLLPQIRGQEIIARLLECGESWEVVAITEVADAGFDIPPGCWGPVGKADDMAEIADVVGAILAGGDVPVPVKAASPLAGARRRPVRATVEHAKGLLNDYGELLQAKLVGLFAYDFPRDRARLRCVWPDNSHHRFAIYANHMHKSQIRDLAFSPEEKPQVLFPDESGRSWRWMLNSFSFGGAFGLRLQTHHQDEVWSLFALYDSAYDAHAPEKQRLLRKLGVAIEDASWHAELEDVVEKRRSTYERGESITDFVHELRKASRIITENLDDLREEASSGVIRADDAEAYFASMQRESTKLGRLVNTMLAEGRIRADNIEVKDLLEQCSGPYGLPGSPESRAPDSSVCVCSVDPVDLFVWADKALVETLIDNLIRNAVYAVSRTREFRETPADQTCGEISVEAYVAKDDDASVVIRVHDSGWGITHYVSKRMWERGFSTTGGTGLGMSICKYAAHRLGGSLEVAYSSLYVGTTFELRLPRAYPTPQAEKEHPVD